MKRFLKQILPPFLVALLRRIFPARSRAGSISRPVFTNTWFADVRENWQHLLEQHRPTKILEIGSFEGASACFLIETLSKTAEVELHCVDSWEGGVEHKHGGSVESDMSSVEVRFHLNTRFAIESAQHRVSLVTHKRLSHLALSELVAERKLGYFDLVYVDGSHQAPDVLFDAVASFKLLRVGGILAFDDYLWREELPYGLDPLRCPKPAIDAFVNLNIRKLNVLSAPLGQLFIQKTSD
jgi:cephalosporin hydroxylase